MGKPGQTLTQLYFEPAPNRHLVREVWFLRRNPIFHDLFTKLREA